MDEFVYERKKMNKKLRKTIRLTAISLGALLTVFLLAVTIVVNFIFTPEKLTPVVLNVANQSLNARLQMKSVELTFFSTFPRFGLKVTDGVLVSKAINDTLWQRTGFFQEMCGSGESDGLSAA